ncbi:MAG: hypothetical protein ABJH05_05645 [Fulvivirga sp.]
MSICKGLFLLGAIFISHSLFSQKLEFLDARPIEILNSEAEELSPMVTPNGNMLYFARAFHSDNTGGDLAGMDIWVSKRDSSGIWSNPSNDLGFWNNRENNAIIGVRKDNRVVYLLNSYTSGDGISFSKEIDGKWIKPELLPLKWMKRHNFNGFYMSPDFDILLISANRSNSVGEEDLYVSLKDSLGRWQEPTSLGATINTEGFEISPYLSADKKSLFFASNGHGGFGDADIFVSQRLYDNWTVWSKPVNLGEKINSTGFDAYFCISTDSTAYFSSNKDGGMADLYSAKLKGLKIGDSEKYAQKLIEEAKQILKELRGEKNHREYFIEFYPESDAFIDASKIKLNDLVKFLNYQAYNELILLSVAYEPEDLGIHDKRIDNLREYLKISGISENKIKVETLGNMRRGVGEKLFEDKDGIVIIVSY